jgi:hypothetical protein
VHPPSSPRRWLEVPAGHEIKIHKKLYFHSNNFFLDRINFESKGRHFQVKSVVCRHFKQLLQSLATGSVLFSAKIYEKGTWKPYQSEAVEFLVEAKTTEKV